MNAPEHVWWYVNIGSGNGLVPETIVDPVLYRHMASQGHNEQNQNWLKENPKRHVSGDVSISNTYNIGGNLRANPPVIGNSFCDVSLNKVLSKQSSHQWLGTRSHRCENSVISSHLEWMNVEQTFRNIKHRTSHITKGSCRDGKYWYARLLNHRDLNM